MRLRTPVKAFSAIVGLVILVVGLGLVWFQLAPRRVPEGQPALVTLDADSADAFREAFNAHDDEIRLLVLLSPT